LVQRRLYEIIGIACGLALLNFGFTLMATGFPGTRQLTSQFLGVNLLVGGSVAVFISLYFMLKSPMQVTLPIQPVGSVPSTVQTVSPATSVAPGEAAKPVSTSDPQILQVRINEFTQSGSGEYERQLAGTVYDMFRIDRDTIIVWRENRQGIRSQYLAGPYELSKKLVEEYVARGEELRIGQLAVSVETLRDLMRLQEPAAEGLQTAAN